MKRLLLLASALAGLCGLCNCANEGWFSGEQVQEKLDKGIHGEGTIGPIDRGDDPTVPSGNAADTHP